MHNLNPNIDERRNAGMHDNAFGLGDLGGNKCRWLSHGVWGETCDCWECTFGRKRGVRSQTSWPPIKLHKALRCGATHPHRRKQTEGHLMTTKVIPSERAHPGAKIGDGHRAMSLVLKQPHCAIYRLFRVWCLVGK